MRRANMGEDKEIHRAPASKGNPAKAALLAVAAVVVLAVACFGTFSAGKNAGREQSQLETLRLEVNQNARDIDALLRDVEELKDWRKHFGRGQGAAP